MIRYQYTGEQLPDCPNDDSGAWFNHLYQQSLRATTSAVVVAAAAIASVNLDSTPETVPQLPVDEVAWQNPVAPDLWPTPPLQPISESPQLVPAVSLGVDDSDGGQWLLSLARQNVVAQNDGIAISVFVTDEEVEGVLTVEEAYWQNPTVPDLWPLSPRVAFSDTDPVVPALGVEEAYWQNAVPPDLWPVPPLSAISDPSEAVPQLHVDEHYALPLVAPSLWPTPPLVFIDDITVEQVPTSVVEEQQYAPPSMALWPTPLVTAFAEPDVLPGVLPVGEDYWQPPTPALDSQSPVAAFASDEQIVSMPIDDGWLPPVFPTWMHARPFLDDDTLPVVLLALDDQGEWPNAALRAWAWFAQRLPVYFGVYDARPGVGAVPSLRFRVTDYSAPRFAVHDQSEGDQR